MSKQRAFVRYTKSGKIVPGSLIISTTYPERSGNIWREVSMDLCCNNALPTGLPFDVTANWSLTTPAVVDEASFRTFLESGEDGDGGTNNLNNVVITNFSLNGGRLRCNLSATGNDLALSEIDATSILSFGNIVGLIHINIGDNLITEMPDDIFNQYTFLTSLNINNITVPVDLSSLINLQRLDIQRVTVPLNLSALVNLEILYANNYEYSTLDVSSLVNLILFSGGSPFFVPVFLDFTNLSNLESINLGSDSIGLTTVNISGCIGLTSISCYNTPTLTTILGLEDCSNISIVQLNNNGLDQTALDYIVVSIDDNGFSNGSITITGNPGTLSPIGDAARLSLISKGWTVNI